MDVRCLETLFDVPAANGDIDAHRTEVEKERPDVSEQAPGLSVSKPSWPVFEQEEIEAAGQVLRSGKVNYWTGSEGRKFEAEYAEHTGRRHAIAVANGTLALELALRALGIGAGDEVITSPRTFIASASCAVSVGARPVFADVDRASQNITADSIRAALTPATKAIIAVHLAGWPCEMDEILTLAREYGLSVIEDCAQAHGACYKGRPVGSMGDVAAFSFCQDKIISTAGEGGMVTLDSDAAFDRAWAYRDHGKSRRAKEDCCTKPGFRWLHESFGSNWRLPEIQSAIGRIALRKLPHWLSVRRRNAGFLSERLSPLPALRIPQVPEHIHHAFYKYYVFLRPEFLQRGWTRDRIMSALTREGVACFSGSCSEIYLEKAFPQSWHPKTPLTAAKELGETSLMFLVDPTQTLEQMNAVWVAVERVLTIATGG